MAQDTERELGRSHLRPVPDGEQEGPEVEGSLARKPGDAVAEPVDAEPVVVEPAVETPAQPRGSVDANGNSNGLTPPSRRGGSGRFVTDHLIELGYTTRERIDGAIAEARQTGRTPEQVLLEKEDISRDQLARAMAERFGLDHVNLNVFEVDLGAVNLIPGQAAKRFEAIPIAFVDEGTLDMFLNGELNKPPLRNFAGDPPFEQQVFELIKVAQAEGWTEALVSALQEQRPRNILIRNLPDALRMEKGTDSDGYLVEVTPS